jgi:TolB-like protein/DNA-binding winged helix-turn-helix (wHTH) protein
MDISIRELGTFRFGPFRLDPVRRALLRDGVRVKLAERLFDTLLYLVANHGRLVERDEVLAAVWAGRVVEDNNLAQAVFTLRKVLQAGDVAEQFIVTVPGRGYRFAAPVVFEPEARESQAVLSLPGRPAGQAAPAWWRGRISLAVAVLALVLAATSLALLRPRLAGPSPFAPPLHSVAVLAFDNMSGDPTQDYLSDGLSEQLIDSLTRIDALQVAARTSSFSFKGGHATIADIARKLNVAAVLEGSVRRDGARVRITAQLINALTGYHYWSKTYDRDWHDLLSLQVAIAQAVTDSLRVTLLGNDVAKLSLGGTGNDLA